MADIAEIQELARTLCLMNIANGVIDLNNETVSNLDYLHQILKQEVELRVRKKTNDLFRESCLPKKLFDETRITSGLRWQLEELRKIDFENGIPNIVIVGECGTGKTLLAVKIEK